MSAVLFDLDGTLLDTPSAIADTLHATLAERGRSASDDRVRATIGRPLAASFAQLTELPEDHAEVQAAVSLFRHLFREQAVPRARELVFPGVPELLDRLRGEGHRIAIVTSKIRPSAEELLRPAGLYDLFHTVVCHGMADRGKPHPDLALLAAERLGLGPEACVVVGDAVDDMRMARSAGMRAVGVTYGVAGEEALNEAGAHTIAHSVGALDEILGTLPAASTPAPSLPAPK
ncbi:HAD family hydrolase [Streptomyces sp. NPDC085481]|uniref:HAD family hydrolase n=1 Tax=Streptomyces sp. NPDC085481 TaxID=3365727 RepID=UPI0037D0B4EC